MGVLFDFNIGFIWCDWAVFASIAAKGYGMAFSVARWSVSALSLYAGHSDLLVESCGSLQLIHVGWVLLQVVNSLGWEPLQLLQAGRISLHLFVVYPSLRHFWHWIGFGLYALCGLIYPKRNNFSGILIFSFSVNKKDLLV